ncbi:hypothetical protein HOY82DRAFT_477373 [Tuber indicum]|nr:hypothetical protein HOY82DRAFT_477373 [Tuber indicum]
MNVVANVEKKKRKSWGQELPIPTTNHPPRKRAKTDEEKEQRRVERMLRNRAAARSSRERKEKQVASMEEERRGLAESNASMRVRLAALEESNRLLREQLIAMKETLKGYGGHMAVVACDVTTNAIARPADSYSPSSFWGHREAYINEDESLLQFLDTIEEPTTSTIDTSVLSW